MSDRPDLESLSPTERLVLCGVAEFERRARTPVRTPELRQFCRVCANRDSSEVVGTVSEADAMRSLYRLESIGAVAEVETDSHSPVGKGRPAYELAVDVETVDDLEGEALPSVDVSEEFWED